MPERPSVVSHNSKIHKKSKKNTKTKVSRKSSSRSSKKSLTRQPKRTLSRHIGRLAILTIIWSGLTGGVVLAWFAYTLPDINKAINTPRSPGIELFAKDGSLIATYGEIHGQRVTLEEIPSYVTQAIMAIEDRRFYNHIGIDPRGIARAMWTNITHGGLKQGASTLTQQLAKNLFLTQDRTLKRKIQEWILALWLEQKLSKDQILTLYLNRTYWGSGTYGLTAASFKYFAKAPSQLTLPESAMLAGLLKAPSAYNPITNYKKAWERTKIVLSAMQTCQFIDKQDYLKALSNPPIIVVDYKRDDYYFADWIVEQVPDYLDGLDKDVRIKTTFDPTLQRLAKAVIDKHMKDYVPDIEVALVAMTNDGAVKAMIGGRDYHRSQFNRATQALRQPGSAFKPVVYLAALEAGYNEDTIITDQPIQIGRWQPKNFDGKYRGDMTMQYALAHSINTVAVQLSEWVGRDQVIQVARRLGVTAPLGENPSIALGVYEMNLLELTTLYASLAHGGESVIAYGVEKIEQRGFEPLFIHTPYTTGQVVDQLLVDRLNTMLTYVISEGTGKRAQLSIPVAGKTGTSSDHRDAWFIGFAAGMTVGVWVGYDDNRPLRKTNGGLMTGGNLPAIIWKEFMESVLRQ